MPAEITQANTYVAEVRVVCDQCGVLIGTRLMPRKQAESLVETRTVCQHCKEKANLESKKA